ncbi:MAG: hypothetical protein P8144_12885, partial [Gammaproteobacteria bacterium]
MDNRAQTDRASSVIGYCFLQQHPAKAAQLLESQSPTVLTDLFARLPISVSSPLSQYLTPQRVAGILHALPLEQAVALVDALPLEQSAPLLRLVPHTAKANIIRSLPRKKAFSLQQRLTHNSDTAGALMSNQIVCFKSYLTAGEARQRICTLPPQREPLCFVAVDARFRFLGTLAPLMIFQSQSNTPLEKLAQQNAPTITVKTKISTLLLGLLSDTSDELVVLNDNARPVGYLTGGQLAKIIKPYMSARTRSLWPIFNQTPSPRSRHITDTALQHKSKNRSATAQSARCRFLLYALHE